MRLPTLLLALAPLLLAEGPEFEVASIKPFEVATPATAGAIRLNPAGGGPGTNDPSHMIVNAMSIKSILGMAFDMKNYQVLNADSTTDMYNFEVVLPAAAAKDDVKIMWRNLLISRFGLKYHMEQREFQVDELTVGPKGHKLIENKEPEPPPADASVQLPSVRLDNEGRPILARPGMMTMMNMNAGVITAKMVAKAQPVSVLVNAVSSQAGHPVVDKTGLTGKYDFFVEYSPMTTRVIPLTAGAGAGGPANAPTPAAAAEPGGDLQTAVQQQLGLRLVKGKGMLDVVVVERINRTPTEN